MGQFGGYYKGDRKKPKKAKIEQKAQTSIGRQAFVLPKVEIIKKGKNES